VESDAECVCVSDVCLHCSMFFLSLGHQYSNFSNIDPDLVRHTIKNLFIYLNIDEYLIPNPGNETK
jgi:hypothetical protein